MAQRKNEPKKVVDKYTLEKVLGKGQFGTVYMARCKGNMDQKEQPVAIKQINKQIMNINQKKTYEQEKQNQCHIFSHPNFVQYIEVVETANNWYIVMEFCNGGDLSQYCKSFNNKLKEEQVQKIAAQIFQGLKCMRDFKILHRDIKPENILLCKYGNQEIIKISDLGLSRTLEKEEDKANTSCGTPLYTSPETMNQEQYNYKADLWSFGVIVYEMLVGVLPYNATSMQSLQRMFKNQLPWEILEISEKAKDFLKQILVEDQGQRKDIYELENHE